MTAPPPPPLQPVDPLVDLTHKVRDVAALELKKVHLSYHVAGAILLILLLFGSVTAWRWHMGKLARLERAASALRVQLATETSLTNSWKARALAQVAAVRVDSVQVARVIYRTQTRIVQVPGVDSAGVPSLVPMQVVARTDFDSLGGACTRLAHDCSTALAAQDSVIAHDSLTAVALTALNANTRQQLTQVRHAAWWQKWGYGVGGVVVGVAIGALRR